MYKIGVFSDIHANKPALDALFSIHLPECDEYVFLGDVEANGGWPNECIERLKTVKNLTLIAGNHDRDVVRFASGELTVAKDEFQAHQKFFSEQTKPSNLEFLASFLQHPYYKEVEGVKLCFLHYLREGEVWAAPDNPSQVLSGIDADVIVFGHTHKALDVKKGGKRFVNFGCVGTPGKNEGLARAGIISVDDGRVNVINYEIPFDLELAKDGLKALNPPRLDVALSMFYGEKTKA